MDGWGNRKFRPGGVGRRSSGKPALIPAEHPEAVPLNNALACADRRANVEKMSVTREAKKGSYELRDLREGGIRLPLSRRRSPRQARLSLAGFPGDGAS